MTINALLAAAAPPSNSWSGLWQTFVALKDVSPLTWCGIVTALAAVWWISAIYLRPNDRKVVVDHPGKLFRALCKAHHLSWRETALLHETAERLGLADPSRLFVREDDFAAAGDTDELVALRKKLFAETAPAMPTNAAERNAAEPTVAA